MKKLAYFNSDLVCLECGNVFSTTRTYYDFKKYGYVKSMWCYRCKCVTRHYDVGDIDRFMFDSVYNGELNRNGGNTKKLETKVKKLVLRTMNDKKGKDINE